MNGDRALISYPWPDPPPRGGATQVAPGILWMRLPLPMALNHVNVYALEDDDGWTIVDTGFATKRTRRLWDQLLTGPLEGKPVRRVLITHHHPDHVGLSGWFASEHGAIVLATRTAWLFARMLRLDVQDRPAPETLRFWGSAGMDAGILAQRQSERPFNYADCVAPMPLGFQQLRDGGKIRLGRRNWTVRLASGHAPDHATLWSEAEDLVIGGDQLLPSISPNLGVYATEPEADPVSDWLDSCSRLKGFAKPEQLVLPGHKLPFRGLPLRLKQLIDNHYGALDRLRQHLRTPHTAAECFQPLFLRSIGAGEYGLALVEAMAHCLHLWHKGEVTREMGADGAWRWKTKA